MGKFSYRPHQKWKKPFNGVLRGPPEYFIIKENLDQCYQILTLSTGQKAFKMRFKAYNWNVSSKETLS